MKTNGAGLCKPARLQTKRWNMAQNSVFQSPSVPICPQDGPGLSGQNFPDSPEPFELHAFLGPVLF